MTKTLTHTDSVKFRICLNFHAFGCLYFNYITQKYIFLHIHSKYENRMQFQFRSVFEPPLPVSITPRNPSQENLRNAEDSESLISSTPMSPLSPLSPISRNQRCLWPKLMEVCSKPCGLVGILSGSQEWSSGCILYTHYSELNWEPPKTSTFESEVILSTFIYIYMLRLYNLYNAVFN